MEFVTGELEAGDLRRKPVNAGVQLDLHTFKPTDKKLSNIR
jgi:hypothetical protein